jgi:hypothetical protein
MSCSADYYFVFWFGSADYYFETISSVDRGHHKVHIQYLEYHSVFPPLELGPPTPSPANECVPPES